MSKIGFLFAGQGSQYVGMGKELYDAFPESKAIFEKADKALGFSLSEACFNVEPETLKKTVFSQPAILTVSIAAFEAFKARVTLIPSFMAGLSLGEYTALIAAGVFDFEQGLKLVRKRAEIMDEAARKRPGKMAAVIDLPFKALEKICLETKAEIANINAPGQVVISGNKDAIDKARDLSLQEGAKRVIELEVSGAFHSSAMLEASSELMERIKKTPIMKPSIPVISNYTALPEYEIAEIAKNLTFQMYNPVKWEESMEFMLAKGVTKFFEFGPGRVLRGLMRKINPEAQVVSIEKKEDIESALKG